jgi:hypothetical protein
MTLLQREKARDMKGNMVKLSLFEGLAIICHNNQTQNQIFLNKLHSSFNQAPIRLQLVEAFPLDAVPGKHQRKIVHLWINSR